MDRAALLHDRFSYRQRILEVSQQALQAIQAHEREVPEKVMQLARIRYQRHRSRTSTLALRTTLAERCNLQYLPHLGDLDELVEEVEDFVHRPHVLVIEHGLELRLVYCALEGRGPILASLLELVDELVNDVKGPLARDHNLRAVSARCLRHGVPRLVLDEGREERAVVLPGTYPVLHCGLHIFVLKESLKSHLCIEQQEDSILLHERGHFLRLGPRIVVKLLRHLL